MKREVAASASAPVVGAAVLVVDDDREIRETVREILVDEGYTVATARDGADALAQLGTFRPQVILLDLNMPNVNGAEFRRVQQRDPALAAIPTVVMTAVDRLAENLAALDVTEALAKPVHLEDLLAVVARYAKRSS